MPEYLIAGILGLGILFFVGTWLYDIGIRVLFFASILRYLRLEDHTLRRRGPLGLYDSIHERFNEKSRLIAWRGIQLCKQAPQSNQAIRAIASYAQQTWLGERDVEENLSDKVTLEDARYFSECAISEKWDEYFDDIAVFTRHIKMFQFITSPMIFFRFPKKPPT